MHVAIVGAGALGRVYGVRLAAVARVEVSFVVRPARVADTSGMRIVRVDGDRAAHEIAVPTREATVPERADVVVVCVRGDQLDGALVDLLRKGSAPIVVMTPMLPDDYERLRRELGPRLVAGMPSVVAYMNEAGAVRYWLPRVATTDIEDSAPAPPALLSFVGGLVAAGIPARFAPAVHESNPATTISFVPLAMALDAAGSIERLLGDRALLELGLDAAKEGAQLAQLIGKVPTWAQLIMHFVGPKTIKLGVRFAQRSSPEAVAYVEEHFGRKLHDQNLRMAREIVRIATEKRTPHAALSALARRLSAGQS